MDDTSDAPSSDQQIWLRIAKATRNKLARRIKDIEIMEIEEMTEFLDCLHQAFWLQHEASLMDKKIDLENMRAFPE